VGVTSKDGVKLSPVVAAGGNNGSYVGTLSRENREPWGKAVAQLLKTGEFDGGVLNGEQEERISTEPGSWLTEERGQSMATDARESRRKEQKPC
jgi:hypothetical protein